MDGMGAKYEGENEARTQSGTTHEGGGATAGLWQGRGKSDILQLAHGMKEVLRGRFLGWV